ncbi:ATP-binding protein [Novosphingobium pentaromativorans]|uniref:Putative anti-sigma regulatory factor,serine/threonine protein kinase n=1 Tax=Novosphingobium pentaromativorans US6-1 TaxID=1088721 RepID=G6E8B7_9SPHN|nr:ATP-binding protein [Novosphingobium pentaromativorans]AIT81394.1 anti-sigma regulatory factor [Novosphingobium pentaromativorans US6-1]EHJ62457.1 putative anti-sigma regulatory factor,serine/threonine protein kinase [Novosphingobium pentaromativorans US6-1]
MDCDYERTLANGRAGFPSFLEDIEAYLESADLPLDVLTKVMIVFDELVSNILEHGKEQDMPRITACLRVGNGEVAVDLIDNGRPFDPLSLETPDTSLSVEEREIGGLGIHIVRRIMDRVEYAREGECNRLRFAKKLPLG